MHIWCRLFKITKEGSGQILPRHGDGASPWDEDLTCPWSFPTCSLQLKRCTEPKGLLSMCSSGVLSTWAHHLHFREDMTRIWQCLLTLPYQRTHYRHQHSFSNWHVPFLDNCICDNFIYLFIFTLCVWVFSLLCKCITCVPGACGGQKKESDPFELVL